MTESCYECEQPVIGATLGGHAHVQALHVEVARRAELIHEADLSCQRKDAELADLYDRIEKADTLLHDEGLEWRGTLRASRPAGGLRMTPSSLPPRCRKCRWTEYSHSSVPFPRSWWDRHKWAILSPLFFLHPGISWGPCGRYVPGGRPFPDDLNNAMPSKKEVAP